jgi:hypothetical protein
MDAMNKQRIFIVIVGILLPYAARVPGLALKGTKWFTSYIPDTLAAFMFFSACNAVCWASILAVTLAYRNPRSAWFPAVFGFAFPLYGHATLDLSSDAQAAIGLILIPIYSLPLVLVGGLIGFLFDQTVFSKESWRGQAGPGTDPNL